MRSAALVLLAAVLGFSAVAVHGQGLCQTYVMQAGEGLESVVTKFNRAFTTAQLEEALAICLPGYVAKGLEGETVLQAGQRICLYPYPAPCAFVKSSVDQDNTGCKFYTVQGGDSLDTIASGLGLTRKEVVDANPGLNVNAVAVNSFVQLPTWDASCPTPGGATPCRFYIAQSGDSLSLISTAFSLDLAAMVTLNNNTGGNVILQPGQKILLVPFTENCGEGVPVSKPSNCRAYLAVGGDSLSTIASMFQTSVQALLISNPELAAATTLSPGSRVLLPPA